MDKELKKKENQTIKYKTMATPFKMKSSPTKGKLGNFFKSVGANLKRNKKDIGADLKEKYNRTKESTPKAGESKYQASVRTRKPKSKSYSSKSQPSVDEQIKTADKQFGEGVQVTAEKSNSSQTFKQAFAAARKANKKTFSWNGKSYTTKLA